MNSGCPEFSIASSFCNRSTEGHTKDLEEKPTSGDTQVTDKNLLVYNWHVPLRANLRLHQAHHVEVLPDAANSTRRVSAGG